MTKGKLSNPSGLHLSEKNFRRFELILERFLTTFPEVFTIEPSELAPTTVCARLRDAVNALFQNNYSTHLDLPKLQETWPQVIVRIRDSKVIIGTRQAQESATIALARDRQYLPSLLTISNPSEQTLLALAILFTEHAISDPVTLTGLVPPFKSPGIVLEKLDDNTWIMC